MENHFLQDPSKTGKLYITEIFYSIQGESDEAGYPCVFVRLSGCDLRCHWCDTTYSFERGTPHTLDEILQKVDYYGVSRVEITGGEPLLQNGVLPLMDLLIKNRYTVLLETGGHRDLSKVNEKVKKIMDIKCPESKMSDRTRWENLSFLKEHRDLVKFVLASRDDYDYAKDLIRRYGISLSMIHFSPVPTTLPGSTLAKWLLEDKLEVRLQLQLHKILNLP